MKLKWSLLWLVMAVFLAVPILLWSSTMVPGLHWGDYVYGVGRLMALLGFVFVFFQYVLSSRIKWIERALGLDRLFIVHRTTGKVALVLLLIHPTFLVLPSLASGTLPRFGLDKIMGALVLSCLVLGAGAALLYRRLHLKYETWKTIHLVNYAVLPLAFLHSNLFGSDIRNPALRAFWALLAALYLGVVATKLWNRARVRRNPFRVTQVIQETHDTWSLHFEGPAIRYSPGQFMSVRLVRAGRVSEAHPFTISSSPTDQHLSITVKSVGDFTATIRDTQVGDSAYIDAPFGVFSFLNHDEPDLVFIAGGIGITPFISMLRYMRDRGLSRRVVLMWGNKSARDLAFRAELERLEAGMPKLRVVHVMSSQQDWPGEKGYVDRDRLSRYAEALTSAQVFVCGPPVMMAKVVQTLRELGVSARCIHYERFALR